MTDAQPGRLAADMTANTLLRAANLALLVLFPLSWFAPLLRTGFMQPWNVPWTDWTFFELDTLTVVTGLQALWGTSAGLALVVTAAAIFAPMLKVIGIALLQFGLLSPRVAPVLAWVGRFAMADIFLLALYVLIFKGMGVGEVEVAWGLYLFTFCVVASIVVAALAEAGHKSTAEPVSS